MRLPTTSATPGQYARAIDSLTITTRWRSSVSRGVEVAAGDQRNPHRRKVPRRDRSRLRALALPVGLRIVLNLNAAAVVVAAERQDVRGADGADAGDGLHPILEPLIERHLIAFLVAGHGQRDLHRHGLLRVEARVHALESLQAANEQPGAHQQHDRQRDFANDERFAGAASDRGALLLAAFLQRVIQILRERCNAGTMPKTTLVRSDVATANASTQPSMPI